MIKPRGSGGKSDCHRALLVGPRLSDEARDGLRRAGVYEDFLPMGKLQRGRAACESFAWSMQEPMALSPQCSAAGYRQLFKAGFLGID
jgi:hypothetical protein